MHDQYVTARVDSIVDNRWCEALAYFAAGLVH